ITGTGGLTITGPGTLVLPNPSNYTNSSIAFNQDVQQINISSNGTLAASGTFTLSFDGATTTNITYNSTGTFVAGVNSTAVNIQNALQALPTVGPGGVLV